MSKLKFRELKPEEIEVRIAQIGNANGRGWCSLLLYKNARVDQNILDETVGPFNWQREHFECKGNLFCRVSINTNYEDESLPQVWVSKSDCGAESFSEKEKGEASDSFKRACVNWNIGRELYSAPQIFINVDTEYDSKKGTYKLVGKNDFYVKDIYIHKSMNKIFRLTIVSKSRGIVFDWNADVALDYRPATKQSQLTPSVPVEDIETPRLEESTPNQQNDGTALNGKTRVKRN